MDMTTDFRHFEIDDDVIYRPEVLTALAYASNQQQMPLNARQYIQAALRTPDRNARPEGAMTGKFPSARMGVSLAIEHGWLGCAVLQELERDPDVVAVFDLPPPIKVQSVSASGRRSGRLHRPTLLVVRTDRTVLVHVIPRQKIEQAGDSTQSSLQLIDGAWRWPAAEKSAQDLGFQHEVWTDSHFDPRVLANFRFLADYFDEVANGGAEVGRSGEVSRLVRGLGSPTIAELLEAAHGDLGVEDAFRALALGSVVADLAAADLTRYATVRLHADDATLLAYQNSSRSVALAKSWSSPEQIELQALQRVTLDGVAYEVAHVGGTTIALRQGDLVMTRPIAEVQYLLDAGRLRPLDVNTALAQARHDDAMAMVLACRPSDLARANRVMARMQPVIAGLRRPNGRSERRYLSEYRKFEISHGNGFLGLVPGFANCGAREKRLQENVLSIVLHHLENNYQAPKRKTRQLVHADIATECEAKGLPAPSYSWLCREIKKLDQHRVVLRRKGTKAAYQITPRVATQAETAGEPTFAFQRAHMDHTLLDVETIFEETAENLNKAWLTLLIDHYTRRVLGLFLTYEPPSARSALMALRDCVRRYNRLPSTIVVDGGKEFRSKWFQIVCAFLKVMLIYRPPRKPRFGSQIERYFGSLNTMFIHNLEGNTKATKSVRELTPTTDPRNRAIWTLPSLRRALDRFLFEVYDTLVHRSTLLTPRRAFEMSLQAQGARPGRFIAYSPLFLVLTCPTTDKGTARVRPDGVKINYYWYNDVALFPLIGRDVQVRYEPYDLSKAYAFVNGKWVALVAKFNLLLRGMSCFELYTYTEMYRKRRSQVEGVRLSDRTLSAFIHEVENEEQVLLMRKRALATSAVDPIDSNVPLPEGPEAGESHEFDEVSDADDIGDATPFEPIESDLY